MADDRPRFGARNLLAAVALAAWAFIVAAFGPEGGLPGPDLGSLLGGLARQGLWFVPIGVLVPLVLPRMRGVLTGFFLVLLPSLGLGAAAAILVAAAPRAAPWRVFEDFAAPGPVELLAPLAGMFAGVLFGVLLARGLGSALLVLPALAAIAAVLLAIVAVALLLLTDRVATTDPIGQRGPPSAGDRAAFADFVRAGAAGSGAALDREFVESGFALALAGAGAGADTRIRLVPAGDAVEITASFPWQVPLLGERFWNLAATAEPSIRHETLRLGVRSLRIGGVEAPATWVRPVSRVLSRFAGRHEAVAGFLDRFDEVRVQDSRLVARSAAPAEAATGVLDYLALLDRDADAIRARPDRFAAALAAVFGLAAERSPGGGAIRENRAALLALGGAVGHPTLLDLAGVEGASAAAEPLGGRLALTVHGRRDWARHFLLSAGLAQLALAGIPEGAGLLKERLDAAPGARGFSFADLLMNEAGARFGALATGDEAAARALQERVAGGITEDDLIPRDSALPEGVSVVRLESEFGDVHGEGFRLLEAEIARRLGEMPLYRRQAASATLRRTP